MVDGFMDAGQKLSDFKEKAACGFFWFDYTLADPTLHDVVI